MACVEVDNSQFAVKFDGIYTRSIWNTKTDEYSIQNDVKKQVTGTIKKSLLLKIMRLNIIVLAPLRTVEKIDKNATIKLVSTIWDEMAALVDKDLTAFDLTFEDISDMGKSGFASLCADAKVMEICRSYRKYDHTNDKLFQCLENILAKESDVTKMSDVDLRTLLAILIRINQIVYPKYSSGMLPLLITELYLLFTTYESGVSKDKILVNALLSQLQRICFDETADNVVMKYCMEKFKLKTEVPSKDEKKIKATWAYRIARHLSQNKSLVDQFRVIALQLFLKGNLTYETLENMYETATGGTTPFVIQSFYNSYDIDYDFDLIPYILHLRTSRKDRLKAYSNKTLKFISGQNKKCEFLKRLIPKFDNIFEQIFFPNRNEVIHLNNKQRSVNGVPPEEYLNWNDFEKGDFSFEAIVIDLLTDFIKQKNVGNEKN